MAVYDRLETDNPLLDEIVYNCKLILKSCVLKDQEAADNAETLESLKEADVYRAIKEGRASIYLFEVNESDMRKVNIPEYLIDEYVDDMREFRSFCIKNGLPYIDDLIALLSDSFLKNHQEYNEYYRKISGLPPIGEQGVYIDDSDIENIKSPINITVPLHEMPISTLNILKHNGIIDKYIQLYPDKKYLKYLTCNINPDEARLLDDHALLYVDQNITDKLLDRFKILISKNAAYFDTTFNNDAYAIYSDHFHNFVSILIVSQTIIDMINEMPEYYIRRDVFDIRTCEYFCEANGVTFFPEIPLKYQIKLVQNLNNLIKFKSTDKCIIDICSLFGFKNIEIFKYYLMKEHKRDSSGKLLDIDEEDLTNTYDLKFIKVPLTETVDKYYNDESNIEKYEEIISGDDSWNGPYSPNYVKQNILKNEFNIVRSKYMSIDAIYSLTDVAFETSYFLNMILYSGLDLDSATFNIPYIDANYSIPIQHLFCYLYALMYMYEGVNDPIIEDMSAVLQVRGFDFEYNLAQLSDYIATKGYTLKDLGVDKFMSNNEEYIDIFEHMSVQQMVNLYINNKNIYDHIIQGMIHADNKNIYDCYRALYDAIMTSEINKSLFMLEEKQNEDGSYGAYAATYTEFLEYKDHFLFERLQQFIITPVDTKDEADIKKENMYKEMEEITTYIIDKLNNDELTQIFSQFPLETGNYVKQYMYKIIDFFKSHRIFIKDLNNLYTLDEDYVYIIDELVSKYSSFTIDQRWPTKDNISSIHSTRDVSDRLDIVFDLISQINRIFEKHYDDAYQCRDDIKSIIGSIFKDEKINIEDMTEIVYRHYHRVYENDSQRYLITDAIGHVMSKFIVSDKGLELYDMITINKTYD